MLYMKLYECMYQVAHIHIVTLHKLHVYMAFRKVTDVFRPSSIMACDDMDCAATFPEVAGPHRNLKAIPGRYKKQAKVILPKSAHVPMVIIPPEKTPVQPKMPVQPKTAPPKHLMEQVVKLEVPDDDDQVVPVKDEQVYDELYAQPVSKASPKKKGEDCC